MIPVSIVIITRNEAASISACLAMARTITNDVVVIDNGSTDGTPTLARQHGCRVYQHDWDGYGANKNKGLALARYNWILSLDADEVPDQTLATALQQINWQQTHVVYDIKFRTYFGKKRVRFGKWGRDHHIRLFNRQHVRWTETEVHETLAMPQNAVVKKLDGCIHHYSVKDSSECGYKTVHYARLSASQYLCSGKKSSFLKEYISPLFGFVMNYIFRLGFLDGTEGLIIALMMYKNTRLKYHYLKLYRQDKYIATAKPVNAKTLAVEY